MSPNQNRVMIWAGLMVALFIGGCESFTKPQGFEQRVAYSYGTYTAVVNTAAHGTEIGTLSTSDAETTLDMARNARQLLDLAHAAYKRGDEIEANDRLALALTVLTELQRYLERRGL